jgi:zinc protease
MSRGRAVQRCLGGATALLGILLSTGACGRGRPFKDAETLSEWRPAQLATARVNDGDGAFRATPPPRVAVKAHPGTLPTEVRLSNGVRVVLLERHDFPSVSAVLSFDRGAAAGPPGVATLYSEAMLGSSTEYKASEAYEYLRFVGGSVNNATWRDAVVLEVTALSPLFVSALSRAAPMFVSPELDGDDVDDARTRLAAMHAGEDTEPADVAHDALYAEIFPAPHPYGTPIAGEPARLGTRKRGEAAAEISKAAVRDFRAANFSAEHVGVAVVGDFNPVTMQRVLEKQLGKIPKQGVSAGPVFPALAPAAGPKLIVIDRPGAAQSTVSVGWPGPRAAQPDLVTLEVLAGATAGDLSTRLNITVRKELGASYGVHMSVNGMRDAGLVSISAAVDTPRTLDATRGILKELDRLRTEPLSEGELAAAKLRTYHDLERGSTRGLAIYLAHAMAEGLPPASAVMHNARVDVVTAEQVRAAAERYLTMSEARIVVVGDAARIEEGLRALMAERSR